MRILYLVNEGDTVSQHEIITSLRNQGWLVDELIVALNRSVIGDGHWKILLDTSVQKSYKRNNYDFIISNTHSSFPQVVAFQKAVAPNLGVIDLEHDLMSNDAPECSPIIGKHSLLITFQNKHYSFAKKHFNQGRDVVMARWPKLDMYYEPLTTLVDIDRDTDCILIGYGGWTNKTLVGPWMPLFRKVWYKPYIREWTVPNLPCLPDQFVGPKGSKYCAEVCKYIFMLSSSCYQDMLLFDRIPILLPDCIIEEKCCDSILSEVRVKSWQFPGVSKFKAVTSTNFQHKHNLFQQSDDLYKRIHKDLFLEWFDEDYYDYPSAKEVILNFIREAQC